VNRKMTDNGGPLSHWESLILVLAGVLILVLFFTYFDKVLGSVDNTPSGRSCKATPCELG
jgi:hypothetical protein